MSYIWIPTKTDRVMRDDWFNSINRVEGDTGYIADALAILDTLTIVNTWLRSGIPTEADTTRVIENIQTCLDEMELTVSIVAMPSTLENLTFVNANNIEENLRLLKIAVDEQLEIRRYPTASSTAVNGKMVEPYNFGDIYPTY